MQKSGFFVHMGMSVRKRPTRLPRYALYAEPSGATHVGALHIEDIAHRSRLHDWQIQAHSHDELTQVLLVLRGTVRAQLELHSQLLVAPAVILVPAQNVHAFEFEPEALGWVLSFDAQRHGLAAHAALQSARAFSLEASGHTCRMLEHTMLALLACSEAITTQSDSTAAALIGALLTQIEAIAQANKRQANDESRRARFIANRFIALVEKNGNAHWPLSSYADALHVSAGHLSRVMRQVYGLSAIRWIQRQTILRAQRELSYTDHSIERVAAQLGFADPDYFSRVFKRCVGLSPSKWRTQQRQI